VVRFYLPAIEREVGDGRVIRIAPMPSDVPRVRTHRTSSEGYLVVEFDIGDDELQMFFSDVMIEVHRGKRTGKMGKIIFKGKEKQVILQIGQSVQNAQQLVFQRMRAIVDTQARLREVGVADLVSRQLDESRELLEHAND
jgi:hypothetical protein